MNKWLMVMVLVLLVLVSAVGLRNLTANQSASQTVASTGLPVTPYLVASTSAPVPVMPNTR